MGNVLGVPVAAEIQEVIQPRAARVPQRRVEVQIRTQRVPYHTKKDGKDHIVEYKYEERVGVRRKQIGRRVIL